MNNIAQIMKNMGPVRLFALAGVAITIIGLGIVFVSRLSGGQMDVLFSDLSPNAAKGIIADLEERNVPFQMANNGTQILVPASEVQKLRVQLSELAVSSGATVGYEIFDESDMLGSTQFTQNVNMLRALEGELARTIQSIDGVEVARVHLVLPKREPFTRQANEPSASVLVRMRGRTLQQNQVIAIQNLLAAAVPNMDPKKVSIIDENGTLLTRGLNEEDGQLLAINQDELRRAKEQDLARSIEEMLERTVGPGKVRAEVNVDMDFNRVVTNKEFYDPDGQVVRSTTTIEENLSSSDAPASVSVDQNLPEDQFTQTSGATSSNNENRAEETINYEITRTTTNEIRETGLINRLSVAVMVDGITDMDGEGNTTWQPRSQEEMDNLAALVRSAIGFVGERGDSVEVINMQFVDYAGLFEDEEIWRFMGFTKEEIMSIAEGLGVAIVAILVILLVVRPLVQRAFENLPTGADQGGAGLLSAEMPGAPQLTGPGGVPIPAGMLGLPDEMEDAEELIDIDKVEGRVKASSLRKIGEIVDKHPEEALSIIRNWLYSEN